VDSAAYSRIGSYAPEPRRHRRCQTAELLTLPVVLQFTVARSDGDRGRPRDRLPASRHRRHLLLVQAEERYIRIKCLAVYKTSSTRSILCYYCASRFYIVIPEIFTVCLWLYHCYSHKIDIR